MTTEPMIPPGMGRCDVTGKLVPQDELVELNGQRVCAEGKAILLERLQAGDASGEIETPTNVRRFCCGALDYLILAIPASIITLISIGGALFAGAAAVPVAASMAMGVGQILISIIKIAYFTILHGTAGRSVGKMAGKLKVVTLDGRPISMQTAFIRALAYLGIYFFPGIFMMFSVTLSQIVSGVALIYVIVDAIVAFTDTAQQRAIHDRIAGTRVILTEDNTRAFEVSQP